MNDKFDLIYFANHPEEWENQKSDLKSEIENRKNLMGVIEKLILSKQGNDFNKICFKSLFWEGFKHSKLWDTVSKKDDYVSKKGSIFLEINLLNNSKHEFYAEYIQGNRDLVNIKIRNFKEIKKNLLSLYSDINYYIGDQSSLILLTDLIIIKFQGKSLNKDFLHLTEAPFLKDSKKLKELRIPYYKIYDSIFLDRDFKQEEKDFAYKLGFEDFHKWDFAFIVLAYREKENPHFLKLWNDKSYDPMNIYDLENLKFYAHKFYKTYNKYKNDNKSNLPK